MRYQSNKGKTCLQDGCNNKAKVKGLCTNCYLVKRNKL